VPVIVLGLKEDMAKLAKERQGRRTDLEDADFVPNLAQSSEGRTRDALADMAGVSHGTLDKVERIEREAIPAGVFLTGISDRVSETLSTIKWRLFNGLETARRQGPRPFRIGYPLFFGTVGHIERRRYRRRENRPG
jgi:transcriptional regulator with XRE-family HTH domain